MKCVRPASFDDIERYLASRLSDEEKQAFEDHYFGCAECFARLEELRTIQEAARTVKPARRPNRWLPGALSIAAAVALAAGLWIWHSQPKPQPAIAHAPGQPVLVAQFEAPPWNAVTLRGASDQQSLRPAMSAYRSGDYAGAARQLEAVLTKQPSLTEARFYLGISRVLSGDRAAGTAELQHVIAAGDTPWLEPARFYLARTLLAAGDRAAAIAQLQQVVAIHGDLATPAQQLLDTLANK